MYISYKYFNFQIFKVWTKFLLHFYNNYLVIKKNTIKMANKLKILKTNIFKNYDNKKYSKINIKK